MEKSNELTVLVIYCGFSSEYKVSEKTGTAVINALTAKNVKVIPFRLSRENITEIAAQKFDVAFIALHGRYGEDGTVQGYLELLGRKYCGSEVMSSALCLNKYYTKLIFDHFGIPTPKYKLYKKLSDFNVSGVSAPIVVKPIDEGSSIGLSVVKNQDALQNAVEEAFKYSGEVMLEEYIAGREVTVAVIQKDGKTLALPVIEIAPHNDFFDYEAKYTKGKTDYIVPARLSESLTAKIQKVGVDCFNALHCKDFARIDIMIDAAENVYALEVNTIPGMTETSLLPKAAAAAGIPFDELILNFVKNNLSVQ